MVGYFSWVVVVVAFVLACCSTTVQTSQSVSIESPETLECRQRLYTIRVTQTDEQGKQCWDTLSIMSCWGRCVSTEISDWRFPYKRSYHPVCVHAGRTKAVAKLRHCEEGVAPGTDRYVYLEAEACRCQACTSSDTSCEGVRYRGHRNQAMTFLSLDGLDEEGFGNDEENML